MFCQVIWQNQQGELRMRVCINVSESAWDWEGRGGRFLYQDEKKIILVCFYQVQIGSDIDTHKRYNVVNSYSRRDVMFNTPPRWHWPCYSHRLTDKGCVDLQDAAASHSNFQALSNLNSKCVLPLTPDPIQSLWVSLVPSPQQKPIIGS